MFFALFVKLLQLGVWRESESFAKNEDVDELFQNEDQIFFLQMNVMSFFSL